MKQVERVRDDAVAIATFTECRLERLETALPVLVQNDSLHVEHRILSLKPADRCCDGWKLSRPVEAISRAEGDLAAGQEAQQAITVELDLVHPALTFGRRVHKCCQLDRGRLAG